MAPHLSFYLTGYLATSPLSFSPPSHPDRAGCSGRKPNAPSRLVTIYRMSPSDIDHCFSKNPISRAYWGYVLTTCGQPLYLLGVLEVLYVFFLAPFVGLPVIHLLSLIHTQLTFPAESGS